MLSIERLVRGCWVSIVLLASSVSAADPVASVQPSSSENETEAARTAPAARPHGPLTAADVAGAPHPGNESGRTDEIDHGDSAFRVLARGALFLPKLAIEVALSPVRAAVWANDLHPLEDLYYRVFWNADRTIGLFPTGTFATGLGLTAGARFEDRDLFGAREVIALQATTGAVVGDTYGAKLLGSARTGERIAWLQLGVDASFDRRSADVFYGIGNGDLASPPVMPIDPRADATAVATYYRSRGKEIAAIGDAHAGNLHLLGIGALADLRFAPSTGTPIGAIYDTAKLTGFDHGVRHAYGELEVRWDTRRGASRWEPPEVHAAGSLVAAFAGRVDGVDGAADFWRYGLEVQHVWRLASGPRLIATRVRAEAVSGALDEVPFFELPSLGGRDFLRGYARDRFRDRAAGVASVQYQWDVSHYADAYLFTDVGRVFPSVSDVTAHDLRVGYGIGLEIHTERRFLLEGSLASSIDGGVFANLSFNPTFDVRRRWR